MKSLDRKTDWIKKQIGRNKAGFILGLLIVGLVMILPFHAFAGKTNSQGMSLEMTPFVGNSFTGEKFEEYVKEYQIPVEKARSKTGQYSGSNISNVLNMESSYWITNIPGTERSRNWIDITLEEEANVGRLIFGSRGALEGFPTRYQIWATLEEKPDINAPAAGNTGSWFYVGEGIGNATTDLQEIVFDTEVRARTIRFEWIDWYSVGWSAARTLLPFKTDTVHRDIMNLFADDSCTTLKEGVTKGQIDALGKAVNNYVLAEDLMPYLDAAGRFYEREEAVSRLQESGRESSEQTQEISQQKQTTKKKSVSKSIEATEMNAEIIGMDIDITGTQRTSSNKKTATVNDDLDEKEETKEAFEEVATMDIAALGASLQAGDFIVDANSTSDYSYTLAGPDYKLQYWNTGNYKSNGVLTILKSGTYTISMKSGVKVTTDRIKINPGLNVTLTINGLNIAPNPTDGYSDHYGQGRPFDMQGATVNLTLKGINNFKAPSYNTGLFCPGGSNLTIGGDGTLNVEIISSDYAVAGIGGEGSVNPQFTKEGYGDGVTGNYDQLARIRQWNDNQESRCGNITINGNAKVNVKLQIGDPDPTYDPDGVLMEYPGLGMKTCFLVSPVVSFPVSNSLWGEFEARIGQPYYASQMGIVGIGGAYDGNITINGGTVDVKAGTLSTGIGSVNRQFGTVKITGGVVSAESGWATEHSAYTDYGGGVDYGPAIGWVQYGSAEPSNMVIDISGGTVTAKSGYGAAGIGGGIDSTGGTIKISGGTVKAYGGFNGAGIGGGIGQSVQGNTTDQAKIIITGGNVTATGGINAAGIGGGGNNLGEKVTAGHSGDILIGGNANVTANGGQNAPGIGAGGSGTHNEYKDACTVQSIVITTTGTVKATGGSGSPTNIGTGNVTGLSEEKRYEDSTIVNLSGATISGSTANMPNLITIDPVTKNLVVKGEVDLTQGTYAGTNGDTVAKGIADYLNKTGASIVADGSGAKLTVGAVDSTIVKTIKDKTKGVTVNGETIQPAPEPHTHKYSGWIYDGNLHWKTCTASGCPDANGTKFDSQAHTWSTTWSHDASGHWHTCTANCGATSTKVAHNYNQSTGLCECGDQNPNHHVHAKGTHHARVDATCMQAGNVEYWDCTAKDAYLDAAGNVITTIVLPKDSKEHNFDPTKEKCLNGCNTTNPNYKPAGGTGGNEHTHTKGTHHAKVEATCVKAGTVEYWDCVSNDAYLDAAGKVITTIVIPIDNNGHNFDAAHEKCLNGCNTTNPNYKPSGGNVHVHAKGTHHTRVDATCVKAGSVEYWDCTSEDAYLDKDGNVITTIIIPIDSNGHNFDVAQEKCLNGCNTINPNYKPSEKEEHIHTKGIHHNRVDATCVTEGNVEYWDCSINDAYLDVAGNVITTIVIPINSNGHNFDAAHEKCLNDCGTKNPNYKPAGGTGENEHVHTKGTHHAKVAATCVKAGTVEYWDCTSKDAYLDKDGKVITTITIAKDANGHKFDSTKEKCLNGCGAKNPNYKPSGGSGGNEHVHTKGTYHARVAATCVKTGTLEYWDCVSQDAYLDASGKAITTITIAKDVNRHNFDSTKEKCLNGCGTKNPNYKPSSSTGNTSGGTGTNTTANTNKNTATNSTSKTSSSSSTKNSSASSSSQKNTTSGSISASASGSTPTKKNAKKQTSESTQPATLLEKVQAAAKNKTITVAYPEDELIDKDILTALQEKEVSLHIKDSGKVEWLIPGKYIEKPEIELDLQADILKGEEAEQEDMKSLLANLLGEKKAVVVNFAHEGALPGKVAVRVPLTRDQKDYLGSDTLDIYHINEAEERLEEIAMDCPIHEDSFVEFSMQECSPYVLVAREQPMVQAEPQEQPDGFAQAVAEAPAVEPTNLGILEEQDQGPLAMALGFFDSNPILVFIPAILLIVTLIALLVFLKIKRKKAE